MLIRQATLGDIPALMSIFGHARRFMAENGNPNQWVNGYPSAELMAQQIALGVCHIMTGDNGQALGTFCFIVGDDPTYHVIEQGAWIDNAPYGVIHRLATNGRARGIAAACLAWCQSRCDNIRIDTHADNKVMQHILAKHGFIKCGIIYTHNGTPRIAYQRHGKA